MFQFIYAVLSLLISIIHCYNFGRTLGAFEESIKQHLKNDAGEVIASSFNKGEIKIKVIFDKSGVYLKRAQLQLNGLRTASVALLILLSVL